MPVESEPVNAAEATAEALHCAAFFLAGAVAVVSPWLFASWEMWWFWTVTTVLCAALGCSGIATLIEEAHLRPNGLLKPHHRHVPSRAVVLLALCAPFLAYALLRCLGPSGPGSPMVAMERERSLALFFTPVGIALVHLLSSRTRWRAKLLRFLAADFVLVGVCAAVNHFATNDMQILWVAANDFHYAGRASAPFYCPNHFADYVFFGVLVMLGTAVTPRIRFKTLVAVLAGAAFLTASGFLSLSRGGLASLVAAAVAGIPLFGFRTRPVWARIVLGALVAAVSAGGVLAARYTDNPLMGRLKSHPLWKAWTEAENPAEFGKKFSDVFWHDFDRGQYVGAALRAWKSNPVFGIGPGQHSNRWAEFEASEDGKRPSLPDRSDMVFPRQRGYGKHLYEVHSDWTQLLEEYGIAGFALFLVPFFGVGTVLAKRIKPCANGDARTLDRALPLGTMLCFLMLAFHSTFDFSLQIPAITWTFATLVSLSVLSEGEAA